MELASNVVWLAVCAAVLGSTVRALRRNVLKVPATTAFTAAFALCIVLLPVISMSDDLLQASQDTLPLAAQSWHLASEGTAHGLEVVPLANACLLAFLCLGIVFVEQAGRDRPVRRHAVWLARAQRLRPPPSFAL